MSSILSGLTFLSSFSTHRDGNKATASDENLILKHMSYGEANL